MTQRNARCLAMFGFIAIQILSACKGLETTPSQPNLDPAIKDTVTPVATGEDAGPVFNSITTSSKGFSIDCVPTSITVTVTITDPSGVTHVMLWYRVGVNQSYTPVDMDRLNGNDYSATVKALDIPVGETGTWEFYISAEDKAGNQSQSPLDTSVQLLPCVSQ